MGLATVMPTRGSKFLYPCLSLSLGHGPGQQSQTSVVLGTCSGHGRVQLPLGTLPYEGEGKLWTSDCFRMSFLEGFGACGPGSLVFMNFIMTVCLNIYIYIYSSMHPPSPAP